MKKTNKILSALLALCMVISLFPAVTFATQAAEETTPVQANDMSEWVAAGRPALEDLKLAINDDYDFKIFQLELAKYGTTFEGYTIYLTNDIVLNADWDSSVSLAWSGGVLTEDSVQTTVNPGDLYALPAVDTAANAAKAKQFGGVFDGMGHTISGLYTNLNAGNAASVFGQSIGSAEVKDVAIVKSYFANGGEKLGAEKALAGIFTNVPAGTTAKISRCYVDIDLYEKSTSTKNLEARFGGLVGYCAGTLTIEDSVYAGSMSFNPNKNSTYRLDGAGGFIGRVNGTQASPAQVTITNSVFAGTIWSPYQRVAGGIGRCHGYANVNLTNCLILGRYYGVSNAAALLSSVLVQGSVVQNVTINDCFTVNTDTSTLLIAAGTNNQACNITANVNGVAKYTLNTAVTGNTKDSVHVYMSMFIYKKRSMQL